ncbi:MAG: protein-disulfide reductase DsbD domain-containing protein [Beijerinckiaceae bacterium]
MQRTQQPAGRRRGSIRNAAAGLALIALAAACSASAQAGASDWVRGNLSQVRLITGNFDGTAWNAGVEIRLKGKAHTYWRNPGDGGVPPQFDFSKSKNIAGTKVLYPAPERSGSPPEEVIGYENAVVFPLRIAPAKKDAAIELDLVLNYAACEKICVPEFAKLKITLKPGHGDAAADSTIARYRALTPKPLAAPDAPKLDIAAIENGKSWKVAVAGAQAGAATDLFAESPEGWYFETRKQAAGAFVLTLVQKPEAEKSAAMPEPFLTLTTRAGAYEGPVKLP